jgi:hypothetical protein
LTLEKVLRWAFPNGIGTRAVLALVVVGYGVTRLDAAQIAGLVGVVTAWYFAKRDDAARPNGS